MSREPMRFDAEGTYLDPSVRCGAEMSCGRPLGHRGHHGGWRTGIAGVVNRPAALYGRDVTLGTELGPGDVTVLIEYAYHHHADRVAACLGLSLQTVKNHLQVIHGRTGATSTIEVFALLGWLRVPANVGAQHREIVA